jgi:hypothetical protein
MRRPLALSRRPRAAILRLMGSPDAPLPLTRDTLRILAHAQGLALSDADLDAVLPLVQAARVLLDELARAPLQDVEPTSLYLMR